MGNKTRSMVRSLQAGVAILLVLTIMGCATFQPRPMAEAPFKERAQTKQEGAVRVTAAVPSPAEGQGDLRRTVIQKVNPADLARNRE